MVCGCCVCVVCGCVCGCCVYNCVVLCVCGRVVLCVWRCGAVGMLELCCVCGLVVLCVCVCAVRVLLRKGYGHAVFCACGVYDRVVLWVWSCCVVCVRSSCVGGKLVLCCGYGCDVLWCMVALSCGYGRAVLCVSESPEAWDQVWAG